MNWPDEVDFTRHLLAIGKEAIPPVHELLKDGDPRVRVAATRLLGEFGAVAAAAVPALLELVDDASINQRAAAIEAIGRIKPNTKLALPAIARHLEDKDEYVRIKAMKAIFEYGREAQSLLPQITKQIKSHFRDPCVTVSIWAAAATMAIEPKEAKALLPEILAVLPHWRDGGWKNAAIEALGKLGPLARVAVPLLSEICFKDDKDDDSTAVSTKTALIAAKALGRIVATGEDLGPLLKMLQNPDPMRRAHAAAAFAAIGPGARLPPPILDQAIPHLLAATQDWSLAVRASARRALKEIASSKPRGS